MSTSYGFKEGWEFAEKSLGSSYASQIGAQYVQNVDDAIQQLAKDMNSKMGSNENIDTLKGFIAEYWHADTFNINAALKGSSSRATIERSTKTASVDVSTNFGKNYSMKYYATGAKSAKAQATNVIQAYYSYLSKSKAEHPMSLQEWLIKNNYPEDMQQLLMSIYQGQGRIIPTDQLEEAIKFLERKIAEESAKEGSNRAALLAGYKETLNNLLDRIKDGNGVESLPLTKSESEALAALCKAGGFKPEDYGFVLSELITSEYILQQSLQAGVTSAVITMVLQIAPEIYKAIDYLIKNGEIDVTQLKDTGLKTMSASAEGFLKGSVSAAMTIACKAGKLGSQLAKADPNIIGVAVTIVVDTMKNGFDVARGKMKPREMATNLSKELIISAASIAGGIAGQVLLKELPVMGYMLGSFVGSVVASVTLNIGEKTILSFCVETGFTFFGLVEQSYELPQDVIEKLGLDIVSLEYVELHKTELNKAKLNQISLNHVKYETLDVFILRRGVVGVNRVGYVF